MAAIRYPGSKERIKDAIIRNLPECTLGPLFAHAAFMNHNAFEYREPFFGAGAIGFWVLEHLPPSVPIWINDRDYGIACLWKSVRETPKEMCKMISQFKPSVEAFNQFKSEDGNTSLDVLRVGFQKLALHQMSYSGLGVMSGGPLGGQSQDSSEYRIDCRWSPILLQSEIISLHRLMRKFDDLKITCRDYSQVFLTESTTEVIYYLDPPYYDKGPELYKHSLSDEQHRWLAKFLKGATAKWTLSYDDAPFIRDLYEGWTDIEMIIVTPTVARSTEGKRPKNKEIVITPKESK